MATFHFIGVAGVAMATLAAMLKARGHAVQGSDHGIYPPMSDFLEREGIRTFDGYRVEHLVPEVQTVIVGNAISRGNPELEAVLDRKIRYQSLPEALREHFLWSSRSLVIAGTHGKTTTTALAGWLLMAAGQDPSVLVGGVAANFGGSYRLGSGRDFVIEGDEYDSAFFDKTAKFLKYLPDIAAVTNLEYDHADIYADMEALRVAFRRLVTLIPRSGRLILGADSPEALRLARDAPCPVETFGLGPTADWRATELTPHEQGVTFEVTRQRERLGHVKSPLFGEHNVRNALAALAVGAAAGLEFEVMVRGLASFEGVKRRLEPRGVVRGVTVIDDFAHHPTAIFETVRALKASYPDRRVWAVFEPRSATACRRVFQDDFVRAFAESGADQVVLASVFRTSLPDDERLSVEHVVRELVKEGTPARTLPSVDAIVAAIAREARDGDVVVMMSNGAFGGIHDKLLAALARG
ncbi:MAG TPA: UDP-N-acetylmuramate:L-alanyl-gamma-D-glutamyl-meso-diaminopimelate ligase [Vicinamibacterales bacterium]|nr:UDP-N-acetylmuramate:L-alanyl-gamma-D-glutamyl-meso-diaminopimelate ligase [Vicinamibacterales bacterium]